MIYHKLCTHLHCDHEPNASIASHMARAAALGILLQVRKQRGESGKEP